MRASRSSQGNALYDIVCVYRGKTGRQVGVTVAGHAVSLLFVLSRPRTSLVCSSRGSNHAVSSVDTMPPSPFALIAFLLSRLVSNSRVAVQSSLNFSFSIDLARDRDEADRVRWRDSFFVPGMNIEEVVGNLVNVKEMQMAVSRFEIVCAIKRESSSELIEFFSKRYGIVRIKEGFRIERQTRSMAG